MYICIDRIRDLVVWRKPDFFITMFQQFQKIEDKDYFRLPEMSWSDLKEIAKNGYALGKEHYSKRDSTLEGATKSSDAMILGSYVHTLLLEPELVQSKFAKFDMPKDTTEIGQVMRKAIDWFQRYSDIVDYDVRKERAIEQAHGGLYKRSYTYFVEEATKRGIDDMLKGAASGKYFITEEMEQTAQWIVFAHSRFTTLNEKYGKMINESQKEIALFGNLDLGTKSISVKGKLDMLHYDAETDTYTIMDYKTYSYPGWAVDIHETIAHDRYDCQLDFYAWLLAQNLNIDPNKIKRAIIVLKTTPKATVWWVNLREDTYGKSMKVIKHLYSLMEGGFDVY